MARTKMKKRSGKKNQAKSNVWGTVQQLENELMRVPAKLAVLVNKEVNAQAKKEAKLQKATDKAQTALLKAEARVKSADKAAPTAASKKKLKVAKKTHQQAADAHLALDKQLQQTTLVVESLLDKQDRLVALDKHLNQFEKEWAKPKATAAKKTVKSKSKPKMSLVSAKSDAAAFDEHGCDLDEASHQVALS